MSGGTDDSVTAHHNTFLPPPLLPQYVDVCSRCAAWLLLLLLLLSYTLTCCLHCGRRHVRVLCAVALCAAAALAGLHSAGAGDVVRQLHRIIATTPTTSLSSAAGMAALGRRVRAVTRTRQPQTLLLLALAYVTLQTLCMPGTVVLNVLVGALVGVRVGVPLCVALGVGGAVACYALSSCVGAALLHRVAAHRGGCHGGVVALRAHVAAHRDELFVYMLFLRLTPLLPNWLVNVASPLAGVPLPTFAAATALGIAPQTYLAVRVGGLAHTHSGHTRDDSSGSGDGDVVCGGNRNGSRCTMRIVTPADTLLLAVLGTTLLLVTRLRRRFAV